MSFHEYNADYLRRTWGFRIIASFNKLSKIKKREIVCHNINILKDLPSEIKTSIIKRCIKNNSDDFVGLHYLDLYHPCTNHPFVQENHMVEKDRKKDKKRPHNEEDSVPSQENSKKVTIKIFPNSLEEIKGKGKEQESHIAEKNSRNIITRRRACVEFIDSEKGQEEWVLPTTKGEKNNPEVITKPMLTLPENIKGKIIEQENHVAEPSSRQKISKKRSYAEFTDFEEEEEENWTAPMNNNENKKPRAELVNPLPETEPELPEETKCKIQELNGSNIKWVFTKRLFESDINKKLGRFSMPANQIDAGFLRDNEKKILNRKGGGIEVGLVGPTGEVSKKRLKKWNMNNNFVYSLISGWTTDILNKNTLEVGHLVHVWSFREGTNLYLALVKVDE